MPSGGFICYLHPPFMGTRRNHWRNPSFDKSAGLPGLAPSWGVSDVWLVCFFWGSSGLGSPGKWNIFIRPVERTKTKTRSVLWQISGNVQQVREQVRHRCPCLKIEPSRLMLQKCVVRRDEGLKSMGATKLLQAPNLLGFLSWSHWQTSVWAASCKVRYQSIQHWQA